METIIQQDDYYAMRKELMKKELTLVSDTNLGELEKILFQCCTNGAANCVAILLEMGVNKDCMTEDRKTPLMYAVQSGSLEVTNLLLTWGCQVNVLGGEDGNSALHLAALNGHFAECEALLNAGANVNIKNEREDTPLIEACMSGHLDIVKLLVEKHASINCRGYHECCPLLKATEYGHYEICSYLITAHARLEDEDTFGNTPLICAAEKGFVNLVLLYLAQGADVNRYSHSGATALHYASKEGWTSCCKVLLHHGAEIDAQDIRRFTPLMMASLESHDKVISLLLDAKCNVNMAAYNRCTALHYAAECSHPSICQLLLESGAYLESLDADFCTPAMLAAQKGNLKTLQFLVSAGANLTRWTRQNHSILHLAAEIGNVECCEFLIQMGVDIDISCPRGVTPVISAIRHYSIAAALFFINKGCSLEKKDKHMVTVLNEAISIDIDLKVIESLLSHGADPNVVDSKGILPLWHAINNCNLPVVKLLLQCNSDILVKTVPQEIIFNPLAPLDLAVHNEDATTIQWLLLAYAEEAAQVFRRIDLEKFTSNEKIIDLVKEFTKEPQSLLRQCRRCVRRCLGTGMKVNQRVSKLKLPSLLHNFLLLSDLEFPETQPDSE